MGGSEGGIRAHARSQKFKKCTQLHKKRARACACACAQSKRHAGRQTKMACIANRATHKCSPTYVNVRRVVPVIHDSGARNPKRNHHHDGWKNCGIKSANGATSSSCDAGVQQVARATSCVGAERNLRKQSRNGVHARECSRLPLFVSTSVTAPTLSQPSS